LRPWPCRRAPLCLSRHRRTTCAQLCDQCERCARAQRSKATK
jgi:hypothetical protein